MKIVLKDGEVFEGSTALDVLRAMKGATMFSDARTMEDYIDMVLRMAKDFERVELAVRGNSLQEKAASLVQSLCETGLAAKGGN